MVVCLVRRFFGQATFGKGIYLLAGLIPWSRNRKIGTCSPLGPLGELIFTHFPGWTPGSNSKFLFLDDFGGLCIT
jgi:hypothetical protein